MDENTIIKVVAGALIAILLYGLAHASVAETLEKFGHTDKSAMSKIEQQKAQINQAMEELNKIVKQ